MNIRQFFHFIKIILQRFIKKKFYFRKNYYPTNFWAWCGIDFIFLNLKDEEKRKRIRKKYLFARGSISSIKIIDEHNISYDDHVTRINTHIGKSLGTAQFYKPTWSVPDGKIDPISNASQNISSIETLVRNNPVLSKKCQTFDYSELAGTMISKKPVCVGLPQDLSDNFILNPKNNLLKNVLHLPIKITKSKALELAAEGRRVANQFSQIRHDHIYLPKEFESLSPLITYVCEMETFCNPDFLSNFYVFLSLSCSIVESGFAQRRGGWHIDGHQGFERGNIFRKKMPLDRQYIISNTLPTQTINVEIDISQIEKYCEEKSILMDDINMQDVIEYFATQEELRNPNAVHTFEKNKLYFLNPYMIHRAQENIGKSTHRTFVRILCSTYPRDRLGDSINPVIGPIYPLKIKTITDIHEMNHAFFKKNHIL